MPTILTFTVTTDEIDVLDDYAHHNDWLHDVIEGRAKGVVSLVPVDPDPYDGDPKNEVADLAVEFHITTCEECEGLKEDHVYAEYETVCGSRALGVEGPISWVLPILRAAHGI